MRLQLGSFLSGTFADCLVPTECEVPNPTILDIETPLAVHPARSEGDGPVCLANAVSDALGINDVKLPITSSKVRSRFAGEAPPAGTGLA